MKRKKISITTALFLILLPAVLGITIVHASPQCSKLVKTYVTVPVKNRVSKATQLAWAKWREQHPNWKPNPNVHRPKYKMTQKEAMDKVEFACQIEKPIIPTPTDVPEIAIDTPQMLIPPVDPQPDLTLTAMDVPQVSKPQDDTEFAQVFTPVVVGGGGFTQTTPTPPVTPGPTPEPSSIVLMFTGIASLAVAKFRK